MPCRSSVVKMARSVAGRAEAEMSPLADRPAARSVGVIFVHGIGNQPPRETLLKWANPIVEMLTEWRREFDEQTKLTQPIGEDPVEQASVEYEQGCEERAWVRIALPQTSDAHPAT